MLGRLADLEAKMAMTRRLRKIEEGQEAARLRRAARVTASAHPIVARGPTTGAGHQGYVLGQKEAAVEGASTSLRGTQGLPVASPP
jgi:hypothetical protein